MGSVLRCIRGDAASSSPSSHTELELRSNSIPQSSFSGRQEDRSASSVKTSTMHDPQDNHGVAFTDVQSRKLSLGNRTNQQVSSLTPEQRARCDYHKAMALARRKEKQSQEDGLLLNWLTPVQSIPSSQRCNPEPNAVSAQLDNYIPANYGSTPVLSTCSAPFPQQNLYCGSVSAVMDSHALPVRESCFRVHDAQYLQHAFPNLHRDIDGFAATHSAQISQQDKLSTLEPVHASSPLQKSNLDSFSATPVHNPLLLPQTNVQQVACIGYAVNPPSGALTLQTDGRCIRYSLTNDQKVRMACNKEKALARLRERQKKGHDCIERGTSQCTMVEKSPLSQQVNYGSLARDSVHGRLSLHQVEHNGSAVHSLHGSPTLQHDGYVSSSLTQRARMACEKEKALAKLQERQKQNSDLRYRQTSRWTMADESITYLPLSLSQGNDQNETQNLNTATVYKQCQDSLRPPRHFLQDSQQFGSSTSVQSLALSQSDTYAGSSLTQEQRVRMAHQKEMAIARRNTKLQHPQDEQQHTHFAGSQCLASSQQSGSSLSIEQRVRMAHHKEMAIARRNARLSLQQDEHRDIYHKPPHNIQE